MNATDKVNILLVDDQPGKLLSYEVMLQDLQENLLKASSANEALEALLRYDVAVILIDVCMPDLDGFELAKMIREHPRFQKTAIIFISAIQVAESDYLRGYDVGAVDYLPVPVVPQLLRAKVRVFAELYRKNKMLERLNEELEERVTERTAALEASNARLLQSERGRSLALAAGNMGSWEYHVEGRWVWDEGHSRIFGMEPAVRFSGPIDVRRFFRDEDWQVLRHAFDGATATNNTFQTELSIQRISGEMRSCIIAAGASFDAEGKLLRIDGVTVDVTDRKQAEQMQALLAREVDHRARNALAIVQAIIRLARADTQEAYVNAVDGRVRALAHTHELLSKSRWQGADVKSLVGEEMAPYCVAGRISMDGPSVILPAEKTQTLGLALHELATNAAKYGALSSENGHIDIGWTFDDGVLNFRWVESGGPRVKKPTRLGFGTKIITASLNEQKGDQAQFGWNASGLTCNIAMRCAEPPVRPHAVSEAQAIPLRSQAKAQTRVLVIEDEALVGMLTCDYLEELGYSVVGPYGTMEECEAALGSETFDVAVLDVNLSGRPVYPLANTLAARGVPFIFVTGYGRDGIDGGFDHTPVVQKPIAKDGLSAAIKDALAQSASAMRQSA